MPYQQVNQVEDCPAPALALVLGEVGAAERVRGRLWRSFHDFFETYDYLLTPCVAVPPFPVERDFPEHIAGKPMTTYVDWIAPAFLITLVHMSFGYAKIATVLEKIGRAHV